LPWQRHDRHPAGRARPAGPAARLPAGPVRRLAQRRAPGARARLHGRDRAPPEPCGRDRHGAVAVLSARDGRTRGRRGRARALAHALREGLAMSRRRTWMLGAGVLLALLAAGAAWYAHATRLVPVAPESTVPVNAELV